MIILPLALGGYNGYRNGILTEIVGLLHFSVAFIISFKLVGITLSFIRNYFSFHQNQYPQLAFALAIILTMILMQTVGSRFKTEVDYDFPGNWDNIAGAVFGVLKFCFALSFFFWFITSFGEMKEKLTKGAIIFPVVESIGPQMVGGKNKQDLSKAIEKAL